MRTRVTTSIASAKGAPIKRVKYEAVALIVIVALSALMLNPLWVSPGVAAGTAPVTQGDVKGDGVHYLGWIPSDESVLSDLPRLTVPESALALPTSVDLSGELPPVGNQGVQGSCVAWATGYYYKSWLESKEHTSWDLTNLWYQYSPSFIYNQINGGQDHGSTFEGAFVLLKDKGCTDIFEMQYDWHDYTTQPTAAQLNAAKPYRNDGMGVLSPKDIDAVKSRLNSGQIFVMGIPIYPDFPDYGRNDPSPYYVHNVYTPRDGYHAVCICGYDDNANPGGADPDHKGGLKMVNSWGPDWNGDSKGFVYLSYDFVKRYVWEAWAADDRSPDTPSIISLSQDSGDWGDSIHIYGDNFGTLRRFAKVDFNGVQAAQLSFTNDDITVTVPENATSGPVTVFDWEGTGSNPVPFTITGDVKPNLNTWVTDGPVYSTVTTGTTTYIGGSFTHVGDEARNNIAAIDTDPSSPTYGQATSWNPNANDTVYALTVSGSTVYAGGNFTTIGGEARNRVAALNATVDTNNATPWDPNANNVVWTLAVRGYTVYAGGNFTSVRGLPRNRIAAIDANPSSQTYGQLTSWDPNANSGVCALAVIGSTVYAGGGFSTIGGQDRSGIAALNATGAATTWNPNANGTVKALVAVRGYTVYAGGEFTTIGGQTRNHIAAINRRGAPTPWDPNADDVVNAIAVSGSTVYAGGGFNNIGGQARNNIAAIDTSGAATGWNPNANNVVSALAVSGSTVYAGGGFTSMAREPVQYFAVIIDNYPKITRISPKNGRKNRVGMRIRLEGVNLPGTTVKLKMKGQPDITATSVTVFSPTKIYCLFDLPNVAGYWNVYVENADSHLSVVLPGGFRIR